MVTKNATKSATRPQAAKKPKPAPKAEREPRSRIAELDVDERRAFEDWKREELQNQAAWEHKTSEELELEFLEKLNKRNKKVSEGKKSSRFTNDSPCDKRKPKIDLEMLAERVFIRLIFEARIERERAGWAG